MSVRHGYTRSAAYYESWAVGHTPTHNPRRTPMAFLEELNAPEWMSRGLCAQTDPEAFYPEKGGSTREAKRVCMACEVPDGHLTTSELCDRAGITFRQADYWTRVGYLHAVASTPGTGYVRAYHPSEIPLAALMARLVHAGLSPAPACALAHQLLARGHGQLAGIRIDLPTEP